MVTLNSRNEEDSRTAIYKNKRKGKAISEVITEQKSSDEGVSNVSVITKTTTPGVILQTKNINNYDKHEILKSVCGIVVIIVIFMNFFLSLQTYKIINRLYQLFNF